MNGLRNLGTPDQADTGNSMQAETQLGVLGSPLSQPNCVECDDPMMEPPTPASRAVQPSNSNGHYTFHQLVKMLVAEHERTLAETEGDAIRPPLDILPFPPVHTAPVYNIENGSDFITRPQPTCIAARKDSVLSTMSCASESEMVEKYPSAVRKKMKPIKRALKTQDEDVDGDNDNEIESADDAKGPRESTLTSVTQSTEKTQPRFSHYSADKALFGDEQTDMLRQLAYHNQGGVGGERTMGEKLVYSKAFSFFSAAIIVVNTFYIGIQADNMVRHSFDKANGKQGADPPSFIAYDAVFCFLFSIELLSRLILLRVKFFNGHERWWHLFDTLIITTSAIELIGEAAGESMGSGMSVLRAIRLVRILRLLRLASSIELIKTTVRSMQTIMHALGGVISSFIPALVILCLCIYIVDLLFLEAVRTYVSELADRASLTEIEKTNISELQDAYGSAYDAFLTLLAAVTGGVDWADVAKPLARINPINRVFFQIYVIFVMLGVLNVIAGLFVNVATTATALDKDLAVDEMIKSEHRFVKKLVTLLNDADGDGGGSISWDELMHYIEDERVKAYFNTLSLDVKCLARLFEILDKDSCGEIEIVDFAKGCIEYRGVAKNIDIAVLRAEIQAVSEKIDGVSQLAATQQFSSGKAGRQVSPMVEILS